MYVTALTVLLLPASVGVLTVHASPTCEKFVRTYVTVPVRNKVSKATALAWAKWREGHPNWKPNPAIKRPRYKMTQQEAVDKVAFACEVPNEPKPAEGLFPMALVEPPTPELTLPPAIVPTVSVPDGIPPMDTAPPAQEAMIPPVYTIPPFIPPYYGGSQLPPVTPSGPTNVTPVVPPPTPVPEPGSLLLAAFGAGLSLAAAARARRPIALSAVLR
jgi:hypothetical protein